MGLWIKTILPRLLLIFRPIIEWVFNLLSILLLVLRVSKGVLDLLLSTAHHAVITAS
jgi:hypothetical protein